MLSHGGQGGDANYGGDGGKGGSGFDDGSTIYASGNGGNGGNAGYSGWGGVGGTVSLSNGSAGTLLLSGATISSLGGMTGSTASGGLGGAAGTPMGGGGSGTPGLNGAGGLQGSPGDAGYLYIRSLDGQGMSITNSQVSGRGVTMDSSGGTANLSINGSDILAVDGAYLLANGGSILMDSLSSVSVTGPYMYNALTLESDTGVQLAAVSGVNMYVVAPTIYTAAGFGGVHLTGESAYLGGGTVNSNVGSMTNPILVDLSDVLGVQGNQNIWVETTGNLSLSGVRTNVASGPGTINISAGGVLSAFTGVTGNIGAGDVGVYLSGNGIHVQAGATLAATGSGTLQLAGGSSYVNVYGTAGSASGAISLAADTVYVDAAGKVASTAGQIDVNAALGIAILGTLDTGSSGIAVVLKTESLDLQGTVTAASGTVAIMPQTAGHDIDVADSGFNPLPSSLKLIVDDLYRINASALQLGNADMSGGDVTFHRAYNPSATRTLAVYGADITQAGGAGLNLNGLLAKAEGEVDLIHGSNGISTLAGRTGAGKDFSFSASNTFTVGTVAGVGGILAGGGVSADSVVRLESAVSINISGVPVIGQGGTLPVGVYITANGLNIDATGTLSAGGTGIAINPYFGGTTLEFGGTPGDGEFLLTTAELARIGGYNALYAGGFGGEKFGNVEFEAPVNFGTAGLVLYATGNVTQGANSITAGGLHVEAASVNLATAVNSLSTGHLGGEATSGDFAFKSSGTIKISDTGISASGDVSLHSTSGSIINSSSMGQQIESSGGNVSLVAATGVGESGGNGPLVVLASGQLTASLGSGDAWITSDGDLSLGAFSSSAGANSINVTTTGGAVNLTVSGPSSGDDNWNLEASGDLILDASGAIGAASATLTAGAGSILTNASTGTTAGVTGLLKLNAATIGSAANPIRFDAGTVSASVSSGGMYLLSVPAFDLADLTYTVPSAFTVSLASEGIISVGGYMFAGNDGASTFSLTSAAGIVFDGGTVTPGTVAGTGGTLALAGPVSVLNDHLFQAKVLHTGTWSITDGAALQFTAGDNSLGSFSITDGSAAFSSGSSSIGSLVNSASGTLSLGTANLSLGTVASQGGLIDLGSGGYTLTVAAGNLVNAGTITGAGTVRLTGAGGTLVNNSLMTPGGDGTIGTISVAGNLAQGSSGILKMDWANTGLNDHISVQGDFASGGSLSVGESAGMFLVGTEQFSAVYTQGTISGAPPSMQSRTANVVFGSVFTAGVSGNLMVSPASITNLWTQDTNAAESWTAGTNWSRGHAPTIYEDAIVDVTNNPVISFNAGGYGARSIDLRESLQINTGAVLLVEAGGLNVNPGGTLVLAGGNIAGSGDFNFNSGGSLTWSGGTMGGTGDVFVAVGGSASITAGVARNLVRDFHNAGSFSSSAPLTFYSGVTLTNSGAMSLQGIDDDNFTGTGMLSNVAGGTITTASGTSARIGTVFENAGRVSVSASDLWVHGGGSSTGTMAIASGKTLMLAGTAFSAGGSIVNNGGRLHLNADSSGTITVGGGYSESVASTVSISGAGGNAYATFNGAFATASLIQSNGTLDGPGNVTAGTFNRSGGSLEGTGTLLTTALASMSGGGAIARTWNVDGALNLTGGQIDLWAGGTLGINAGAVLDLQASYLDGTALTITGVGTLVNNGTLRNSYQNVDTGKNLRIAVGSLQNNGVIEFGGGANVRNFEIGGSSTHISGSTVNVAAGKQLMFRDGGTHSFAAGSLLDVGTGGTLANDWGTTLNVSGTFSSAGTLVAASGTINFNTGSEVFVPNLVLTGEIGGNDAITVTGTAQLEGYINAGTGAFKIASGATATTATGLMVDSRILQNAGTFNLTGGSVTLAGIMTLQNQGQFTQSGSAKVLDQTADAGPATIANQSGGIYVFNSTEVNGIEPYFQNGAGSTLSVASGRATFAGGGSQAGIIDLAAGTTLSTAGATLVNASGGVIQGSGTLDASGAQLINNGTLRPGGAGAAGTLTVMGGLDMTAGAVESELYSLASYDVVRVLGDLIKGGTINVSEGAVFVAGGNAFDVVTWTGTLNGSTPAISSSITDVGFSLTAPGSLLRLTADSVTNRWVVDTSGTWTTAANWSRGHAPNQFEDAVVDRAGANTVTISAAGAKAKSLEVVGDDILSISGASSGLSLGSGGGTLSHLSMNGGTLAGGAVAVSATADLSGEARIDSAFSTSGTVTLSGTGAYFWGGASFSNATLDLGNASGAFFAAGSYSFVDTDIFGVGSSFLIANNSQVTLSGTSQLTDVAVMLTDSGGQTPRLTLNNTAGANTLASYHQSGAGSVLDGTALLEVAGDFSWEGGTMSGTGVTWLNNSGYTSNIITSATTSLSRTLKVETYLTIDGAVGLNVGTAGMLLNESTGTIALNPGGTMAVGGGAGARIVNNGNFIFDASSAPSSTSEIGIAVENNTGATLYVSAGTLKLTGPLSANAGIIHVLNPSSIFDTGNRDYSNAATGTIAGLGTISTGTGTLTNSGALLPGGSSTTGTLTVAGNLDMGTGTVYSELAPGPVDMLEVTGNLVQGGTLDVTELVTHVAGGQTFDLVTYGGTLTGTTPALSSSVADVTFGLTAPVGALRLTADSVTNRWNLDAGGLWTVAANWSRGHAPNQYEDAVIDRPTAAPVVTLNSAGAQVLSLAVNGDDTLRIAGASASLTLGAGGGEVTNLVMAGGTLAGGAVNHYGVADLSGGAVVQSSFTSTGTLDVSGTGAVFSGGGALNAGTLNLAGGSGISFNNGSFTFQDAAINAFGDTFNVIHNGHVTLSGTTALGDVYLHIDGTTGTGGRLTLNNTGTNDIGDFYMHGANALLDGTAALAVNGDFTWSGGTIAAGGTLTVNSGVDYAINTSTATLLNRTLVIQNLLSIEGSNGLELGATGTIINDSGAILFLSPDGSSVISTASTGRVINNGTIAFDGGFAPASTSAISAQLDNNGTLQVVNGALVLAGTLTANAGVIDLQTSATELSTSSRSFANGAGGSIVGFGTLNLGSGTLTNDGTINPGDAAAAGVLHITGNYVQGTTGTLNIDAASSSVSDKLQVSGTATLAGTLNVGETGGYTIGYGDGFMAVTAASVGGTFTVINGPMGVTLTPVYNATSLNLYTAGGPINNWIGTDGDWSIGTNWSLGRAPATGDVVTINPAGINTITLASAAAGGLYSLDFSAFGDDIFLFSTGGTLSLPAAATLGGTLHISGGTLTSASGPQTANVLKLSGGRLENSDVFNVSSATLGSGTVIGSGTLNVSGVLDWTTGIFSGGTLNTSGTTTLANGTHVLSDALWTNTGTVTHSGGSFSLTDSIFSNQQVFINTEAGGDLFESTAGSNLVHNTGTFNWNQAGTRGSGLTPFNNDGVVNVNTGATANMQSGGSGAGSWVAANGATLQFSGGSRSMDLGSDVTGAGTMLVNGGIVYADGSFGIASTGTVTMNSGELYLGTGSPVSFANAVTLSSGATLDLANDTTFQSLVINGSEVTGAVNKTVNGLLTLNGGAVTGGTLTTSGGASLSGTNQVLSDLVWLNPATIAHTSGTLHLNNGSTLVNQAGGVINETGNGGVQPVAITVSSGANGFIDNAGTINWNVAGSRSIAGDVGLDNTGTINITGGALNMAGTAGFGQSGKLLLGPGTTFQRSPGFNNTGYIAGTGTIDVAGGTFTNMGTLSPGGESAVGTLHVAGNFNMSSGTLLTDLASTSSFDLINVTGNLVASGTVEVSELSAFVGGNDNFNIMTYGGTVTPGGVTVISNVTDVSTFLPSAGLGVFSLLAYGVTNYWLDGITGNWATGVNWTRGHAPNAYEDVIINPTGTQTITVNSGSQAARVLSMPGDDRLVINGGSLSLGQPSTLGSSASLTLTAGSLGGAGSLAIEGALLWTGGTLAMGAGLATSGQSTLSGVAVQDLQGDWSNTGTIAFNGGNLQLNGANLDNLSGGVFKVGITDGFADGISGNGTLTNQSGATFHVTSATTAFDVTLGSYFVNDGTVTIDASFLDLERGVTHHGSFAIASGAALRVRNNETSHVFAASSGISGAGYFEIFDNPAVSILGTFAPADTKVSGGQLNFNGTGPYSLNNLTMTGGTLGGGSNVSVSGAFDWAGGTVAGASTLSTSGTVLVGTSATLDGRVLDNTGAMSIGTGKQLVLKSGAQLKNQASGTLTVANAGAQGIAAGTGGGSITNAGKFVLANSTIATGGGNFSNSGQLNAYGKLDLGSGTLVNTGTLSPGGAGVVRTLAVTGNADLTGGTFVADLAGTASFDLLAVSGNLVQGGTLVAGEQAPFIAGGDSFNVVTYGGTLTGTVPTLSAAIPDVTLTLGAGAGALTLTAASVTNRWNDFTSGDWSNGTNWTRGHTPNALEDVIVNPLGVQTVTVGSGVQAARSLQVLGDDTLSLTGGSLALGQLSTVASGAALLLSAGTLGGAGGLNVAGSFGWTGGTLTGAGAMSTTGPVSIAGGPHFLNNKALTISAGTATYTGGSINVTGTGGTLAVASGATLNLAVSDSASTDVAGDGTFDAKAGSTINMTAPAGSNSIYTNQVNFAGTLNLLNGSLDFDNPVYGSTIDISGTLNLANGTSIIGYNALGGTPTVVNFNPGAAINLASGSAALNVNSWGLNFNTPLTLPAGVSINHSGNTVTAGANVVVGGTYALSGGMLTGTGNVTLNNAFNWSGGTAGGTGVLATSGASNLSNTVTLTGKTLDNSGSMQIGSGATLLLSSGAQLNNLAAGTLVVGNAGGQGIGAVSGGGSISNAGKFELNGSTIATGGGSFSNSGTLIASGKLDLGGTGSFSNAGLLRIAGAGSIGTLSVVGNASLGTGTLEIDLAGPASYDLLAVSGNLVQGGTLGVSENTVFIAGGNTFNVVTYGGTLTGTAPVVTDGIADVGFTLNAGSGALQLVAATVSNSWLDVSGNWATGSNWSRGHTPNSFEDAFINPLGTQLVTLSSGAQAPRSLQLVGDDTLSITGGSLDIANASTVGSGASFVLAGGVLSGSGALDVAGSFDWNAGKITAGAVNVAGVLTIGNAAVKELTGTLSHSNASGLSSWIGGDNGAGGVIDIIGGGRLVNQAGAVLEIATGGQSNRVGAYGFSPVGFIDNYGTLDVTGGGMFAFSPSNWANQQHQLRNFATGVVNVTDSHLYMHNDASSPIAQLGTWNFTGSSGTALLNLYGNNTWGAGATINTSGATSLAINGPTQLYSAAAQSWATVSVTGGSSLAVNQNFTVTDAMSWAGSVTGSGGAAITLGSGANTTITGTSSLGGANLVNEGTLTIGSGATLNAGQLVSNAGLVALGGGTLTASSGLANSGTVSGNGQLNTSGSITNTGTISPGGAGTVGTISISGNVDLSGGTMDVDLASPSSHDLLAVSGSLVQGGTLNVSETTPFISASDSFDVVTYGGTVSGSAPVVNSSISGVALGTSTTAPAGGALRLAPTSVTNFWLTGSGDWTDSSKWSRGHAPTSGESITVDPSSGAETVTVSSGASGLASLVLGTDDSFLLTGGNFVLPVASSIGGTLTLAGGTLTNSGAALSVSALNWDSGTIGGSGSIAGALSLSGTGSRVLTGSTVTSFGGVTLSGGDLQLDGGAFGWSSGTLTVAGGATLGINGGAIDAGPLLNLGTVAIGSAASALTSLDGGGTQTGQFTIASGKTLNLGTGNVTLAAGAGISGGTWTIDAGQVSIAGTLDRGAGAATALGGGTLSVAGAFTTASLAVSGGLLNGAGDLTVTDSFSQGAGSLGTAFDEVRITQQSGDLTIAGVGAASVTLASLNGSILDGNAGATNITAGNVKLSAATGIDIDLNTPLLEASLGAAGTIDVSNTGALELTAITAASGSANFTVGGPLTQSGAVQVMGPVSISTGGAGVTLNHAGNQFDGTISLLGTGATSIVDTSGLSVTGSASSLALDAQDVSVGSLTVSGPLTIVATGQISQGASISVTGLTSLSASTIVMPTASTWSGGVTFNAGGAVTLASSGALVLRGTANHAGGTLSLTAAGAVSQTSALTAVGAVSVSAAGQTVDFGSLANDFSSVSFNAASVLLNDINSVGISGSVTGNVAITAASGVNNAGSVNFGSLDITLTGTGSVSVVGSNVAGAASFATSGAGSYQDITYSNNSATGSVGGSILASGTVTLAFKNTGLALPQIQAGTLFVGSGGALTQTGAISAANTELNAVGYDINLLSSANHMGTLVIKANNASITDAGTLNIDGDIAGALQISAAALSQTPANALRAGSATLSGTSGIAMIGANELGTLAAFSGGAITVNDIGASLTLGNISTPASLAVQSGGAVLQSTGATLSSGSLDMLALSIGTPVQPLNFSAPVATLYGVDGGVHAQSAQAFNLAGLGATGDATVSSAQALSVVGEAFCRGKPVAGRAGPDGARRSHGAERVAQCRRRHTDHRRRFAGWRVRRHIRRPCGPRHRGPGRRATGLQRSGHFRRQHQCQRRRQLHHPGWLESGHARRGHLLWPAERRGRWST